MDLNKKRVSFSHIIVPKHLRSTSSASSASSSSTAFSLDLVEQEDQYSPNQPKPPPPTFKTLNTLRIPLGDNKNVNSVSNQSEFSDISLNPASDTNETTTKVSALKFLETRRRSHAFSVSAIDETLPVNMDGEYYEYGDDEESEQGGRGGGGGGGGSNGRSSNVNPKEKYFRAAEIPIGGANRVLICQTKNEIIDRKSFQHEIRAIRDMDSFLARPNVLLDCDCNSVETIVDQMLELFQRALSEDVLNEARAQLYAANNAAYQLTNVIQNVYLTEDGQYLHDPSWLCTYASIGQLQTRRVVIARLKRPTNFGPTLRAVQFVIMVLVPANEKTSKNAFEIARTFSSLFSESSLRIALLTSPDEERFCATLEQRVQNLKSYNNIFKQNLPPGFGADGTGGGAVGKGHPDDDDEHKPQFQFSIGKGLVENFQRRIKYYPSDFIDGVVGEKTWLKVSAATLSLFFACLLPCVAFGVVDANNTNQTIGPKEALFGQAIGGLAFAVFSGQPLVIIATTAPLCLYTQVVYTIAQRLHVDFRDLFAAVGLWNAFFLLMYSLFDLSQLMHFCTRSTEEIFATFIFFAFTIDALKQCAESFHTYYCFPNASVESLDQTIVCAADKSILFLFLMFGTVTLAILLYNFSSTPYLNPILRETFADYALPLAVIIFSLIGSIAFQGVEPEVFDVGDDHGLNLTFANMKTLTSASAILLSLLLGLALSILFFIDQNVSAALVSAPSNRLQKGDAYHWDLLVVAILNIFLSLLGLPWMHGILPHSPMHARALADVVQVTDAQNSGSTSQYVVLRVRETRVTGILIHVLIALVATLGLSLVKTIPVAVLSGLLLFCAVNTLRNNSLYDRVLLMFTQQTAYPPSHYLRYCPQRLVHLFTGTQLLQLGVICVFGFVPVDYVQLVFPLIIGLLIPIRWLVLPRILEERYLSIVDSKHF